MFPATDLVPSKFSFTLNPTFVSSISKYTYLISSADTKRPYAAPHSRQGTNSPLGTWTPYVQQASRKKKMKKIARDGRLN